MFYKIIFFRRIRERNKRKPEVVWKNVARAARAVGKSDFTKLPRIFQIFMLGVSKARWKHRVKFYCDILLCKLCRGKESGWRVSSRGFHTFLISAQGHSGRYRSESHGQKVSKIKPAQLLNRKREFMAKYSALVRNLSSSVWVHYYV